MVQPNYAFQKRQRDLAKKQKKEEKKLRKASGHDESAAPDEPVGMTPEPAAPRSAAPGPAAPGPAVPAGEKTLP